MGKMSDLQSFKTYLENSGYYRGLGDSTADKRRAQFNRQADLSDDDPDSYKPAPGDAHAKTKVSKWTKAYADKYGMDEDETLAEAEIEALRKKSEKTGIAYGILKKVFDRGMAAWKTGHRPGASQHQWAFARTNSFIMGGPTQKTTDADLWAQHKGK
jgi:hypothetical protein